MKLLILVFLLMGSMGLNVDFITRQLDKIKGIKDKLKSLKYLLNIVVYGTGGTLVYLLTYIPIFRLLDYLLLFMLTGAIVCTLVEFGFGLLFNRILKLDLWEYTMPFNIMGQTDIVHFFLWGLISIPVYWLSNLIK
jgi:uncharacterized membrane protein